jgi:hypothetical protein
MQITGERVGSMTLFPQLLATFQSLLQLLIYSCNLLSHILKFAVTIGHSAARHSESDARRSAWSELIA